jgi:hypothetical protein
VTDSVNGVGMAVRARGDPNKPKEVVEEEVNYVKMSNV